MRVVAVVLFLGACAHRGTPGEVSTTASAAATAPAAPKLARAEAKALVVAELATPTTDPTVLAAGEAGYRTHCVRCHDLEAPSAYGRGDWEDILPEMVRESRVDAAEARAISAWVLAGAGK